MQPAAIAANWASPYEAPIETLGMYCLMPMMSDMICGHRPPVVPPPTAQYSVASPPHFLMASRRWRDPKPVASRAER